RPTNRDFQRPLILRPPKGLLRHKRAVSRLDEMGSGRTFHRLLWDDAQFRKGEKTVLVTDEETRRVILCSGKVYFDLYEDREKRGIKDIYLLRVEQLYPFPIKALVQELSRFKRAEVVWCQEEPRNMGAWHFVEPSIVWGFIQAGGDYSRPGYVVRPPPPRPATGLLPNHFAQCRALLELAFNEG